MIILILQVFFFFQEQLPAVLAIYPEETKAILIFAPDNRSSSYNRALNMLIRDPLGIDSRNIQIFEIFREGGIGPGGESYSREDVDAIRNHFQIDAYQFRIVLSGNNFSEIFSKEEPFSTDEIFQHFDQLE